MKTIINYANTQIMEVDTDDVSKEYATKEMFLNFLKQEFKKLGFKKEKNTWYNDNGTITFVFSIQNSQFGKESFYMNIGVVFSEKGFKPSNPSWDGWARMQYGETMQDTFNNIIAWFEKYNTIEKIIEAAKIKKTSLNQPSWGGVKKYLERHHLDENGKQLQ